MQKFSGTKLRKARGKRTQTDVALALQLRGHGTTQTQVSRWESGQKPHNYILMDIAEVLGLSSTDELFEEVLDDAPFPGRPRGSLA